MSSVSTSTPLNSTSSSADTPATGVPAFNFSDTTVLSHTTTNTTHQANQDESRLSAEHQLVVCVAVILGGCGLLVVLVVLMVYRKNKGKAMSAIRRKMVRLSQPNLRLGQGGKDHRLSFPQVDRHLS